MLKIKIIKKDQETFDKVYKKALNHGFVLTNVDGNCYTLIKELSGEVYVKDPIVAAKIDEIEGILKSGVSKQTSIRLNRKLDKLKKKL